MNIAIKLPEKIKDDILSITRKDDVVDGIKDLVRQELTRKKAKYLFMDEEPCGRDRRASKNPIFVLLSFPLVGNPSERFWTSQNDRIR